MKRLAIFLFFFVFSISAFALDESLFAENFSLIKDPGENNLGFLNLNILSPRDYFFFSENKKHARQHQKFQKFGYLRISGRAPLSRIATAGGGRQNWGDMYNPIYGQQEDISSEEKLESLAEGYFKRLAVGSKADRMAWGAVYLVGGGVIVASGVDFLRSLDVENPFHILLGAPGAYLGIAAGTVLAMSGFRNLVTKSRAERELDNVLSISDPGNRERASRETLSSLAARGKRGRTKLGIIWSVFSAISVGDSPLIASACAGVAIYNFVVKSRAERTFQNYLEEKEFQNRLEFRLGIMPHGGVKVGLVYSF